MKEGRTIELLSPAKNLECGIEAIKHGADAVYIGAGRFGARQAAGNSVADIAELARFAHFYGAKVYVTVNTILKDSELADAEKLIWQLYEAGADALLVQDMAVLRMKLPPIALHASTQCDVRSADKVRFLADCGFTRVVLARELSLAEITDIHGACPDVELECFVHGALCVSYSGQCYASQYCFGRSANRGECAQFCRLKFDLVDADDNVIIKGKHLLSLRDMNRMPYLEELTDAGVCSFKIEGRLKDVSYVKNVTAAYNQAIESVLKHRPDLLRASSGRSIPSFTPDVNRSFNRGFTDYFLHGRTDDIYSFNTPKSIGEKIGTVKEVGRGWLTVSGFKAFHNGDGLCFFNREGELEGYRVNRVDGGRIFLFLEGGDMPAVKSGTDVYRNFDQEFEKILSKESASRKIGVSILFEETEQGYKTCFTDEDGQTATYEVEWKKEDARTPQEANIKTQLSKLGNTGFEATGVDVRLNGERFIPSSLLSEMRRSAVEKLERIRLESYVRPDPGVVRNAYAKYPAASLTYLGNVMNAEAGTFYHDHGVTHIDDAFEKTQPDSATIMFCRHCIKYALGLCTKRGNASKNTQIKEPIYLQSSDGRRFALRFDCSHCQMEILISK
ncbi:MAG: U32 family peptidase [Bacteroidaceae bacterium]|nr:U32 family peptidase [Bacteroidaceae bacterium]